MHRKSWFFATAAATAALAACGASDVGGPTADAIAESMDDECSGGPVERTSVPAAEREGVQTDASTVTLITCDGGGAPASVLLTFSSRRQLQRAMADDRKSHPRARTCVMATEAYGGGFDEFTEVCERFGGAVERETPGNEE
jgi:hypothetical protein